MPVDISPFFRRDVLRPRVREFVLPERAALAREKLRRWAGFFAKSEGLAYKETELLPDWLTDVFQDVLGYTGPSTLAAAERHTIKREKLVEVGGKFADAVLGDFGADAFRPVVAVEGKGPLDPLDRPHAGRKVSAVDQAYGYAINLPCDWILVTSLRELRLYHKGANQRTYERWLITDLANDDHEFKRLVFVLGAERVVPAVGRCHLYDLLDASERAGEALTQGYYADYARVRRDVLAGLTGANAGVPPTEVLAATQRLLDRVLFIAFAEDRGLLPRDSLAAAFEHRDPYNPRPIWENFRGLFHAIDQGSTSLGIPRYNGGLFAAHAPLDSGLAVPDAVCERFKRLGEYNYRAPSQDSVEPDEDDPPIVDVEILGHIFEQSIEDLEALRAELEGGEATRQTSRRKREGAFYTPQSITRYLVSQALDPVLAERFERLRQEHHGRATGSQPKTLVDPAVYDLSALFAPQREALVRFWEAWLEELARVRVLDPACGSGAFLIEAFDQLHGTYAEAVERLADLRQSGDWSLFDPDRTILQQNLFGVDLNEEAVEIARLSIWVKTAQRGKVLADLDHNIRVGNSVVADTALDARAFDWAASFPEVFAQGGFDVVIGNPPYVRAELLTPIKPYLQEHYHAFHGQADLYVYFYELGMRLLRPGGRLSYIVTNKWLKTGYGEPLRRFFAEHTWMESVVDLGHARGVFPDADVFPAIVLVRKPDDGPAPESAKVSVIPRDDVDLDRIAAQAAATAFTMPRRTLTAAAWTLEPPGLLAIFDKMRAVGVPLREYVGTVPRYGIKTGYNEAFLLSTAQRDALVAADPKSADVIRPYLRGQDVQRWRANWAQLWMIVMRSSQNYDWPWRGTGERAETVFADTYPALYRHFKGHEPRLRRRSDQGTNWWELRSCDYYDSFKQPKVIWKDLSFYSEFAFDREELFTNDLCFFVPTDDLWLVAVLNSPLVWSFLWRTTAHGKDEVLRLKTLYMQELPVARPTDAVREQVTRAVGELLIATEERRDRVGQLHDWLRSEFGVEKPGEKLSSPDSLSLHGFVDQVKARRPGRAGVTGAELRRLRDEYGATVPLLRQALGRTEELERAIAAAVHATYRLTEEEIALLWRTAPPRMPVPPLI